VTRKISSFLSAVSVSGAVSK